MGKIKSAKGKRKYKKFTKSKPKKRQFCYYEDYFKIMEQMYPQTK